MRSFSPRSRARSGMPLESDMCRPGCGTPRARTDDRSNTSYVTLAAFFIFSQNVTTKIDLGMWSETVRAFRCGAMRTAGMAGKWVRSFFVADLVSILGMFSKWRHKSFAWPRPGFFLHVDNISVGSYQGDLKKLAICRTRGRCSSQNVHKNWGIIIFGWNCVHSRRTICTMRIFLLHDLG